MREAIRPNRQHHQITDPFVLDDLRQMEYATRYNRWLYDLVRPYLGRRILEIGPGIGNISRLIVQDVDLLVGMEPNPHCAAVLAEAIDHTIPLKLLATRVEDSDWEGLRAYAFDTILCMNVIEHVKDDQQVLGQFARVLAPGGRVVLLVPAFPQAYGPIDASVGHFRRYTKPVLRDVLTHAGLSIEYLAYTNMLGLLGWMVNARIRKVVQQSDSQIRVFDALVPVLRRVERLLPVPFGLSIVASARKIQ